MRLLTIISLVLALCVGTAQPGEARPKSAGQASQQAVKLPPGTLLSYDRIGLPRNYRATAWRILYVTRDYRMQPILSTGLVVLPDKAARVPMERNTR